MSIFDGLLFRITYQSEFFEKILYSYKPLEVMSKLNLHSSLAPQFPRVARGEPSFLKRDG